MRRIVVLSGGVGGARFLRGLAGITDPAGITVIGNVGDDLDVLGLHVSPDLDSVLYALAGVADDERGWGRAAETWHAMEELERLGAETWFRLGDRDLALHVVRTAQLREGRPLSAVMTRAARALGVGVALLPATDDLLRTWVDTPAGSFAFQEWFVARSHSDAVDRVRFEGEESARPAPGVMEAIAAAEIVVIAPSNPFISIWPILAVGEIRQALEAHSSPCIAVSPLVGGRALKGPADSMLERLAGGTGPERVATCYQGLADVLVIDESDAAGAANVEAEGVRCVVARTLMSDLESAKRLAGAVLGCA